MTEDMLHVMEWHHGEKAFLPFSAAEMTRRLSGLRAWMAGQDVDAVLFTSHASIAYHSGWVHCSFGRRHGMVVTQEAATTISPAVDGGQPWRRSFGGNVSYTDWRRDNFFRAVRQLTAGVRRLGIECDAVPLEFRRQIECALPGVDLVDAGQAAMWQRLVKSEEEIALLRTGARIAERGAAEARAAIAAGVAEHEVAIAGTDAMIRAIAEEFPSVDLMDSWTWFRSGQNTDGAHNPVTNRRIGRGDILSLACCPMLYGYLAAVGRTLFCGEPAPAALALWERNLAVHRHGLGLIRPGARCADIAAGLNALYREAGILHHRSHGYGHSFGIMGHYYGRDWGLELREDVATVLEPGMVLSMEPMVTIPEGRPDAGGYREQDMVLVTETGSEVLTRLPMGPEDNVLD